MPGFFRMFTQTRESASMTPSLNNILVLRLSSIGDIILTTPFLRALRRRFPDCTVQYAVRREFSELLRYNPHIDRLITVDITEGRNVLRGLNLALTRERFDAVFDLHNNFRTRVLRNGVARRLHTMDKRAWRRLLLVTAHVNFYQTVVPVAERYIETGREYGLRPDAGPPEIHFPEDVRGSARLRLRAAGWRTDTPLVGMCPGAKHFTKRWPAERWTELARLLFARGYHVALLGSDAERDTAEEIRAVDPSRVHDCTGRLSLLETAAAMTFCRALFTNDSGLMHMGTAAGRPVVAVFGSTVREFGFFPYNTPSAVLEVDGLRCRPCTHIGRADCHRRHLGCLRLITAGDAIAAFEELMRDNEQPGTHSQRPTAHSP